MANRYQGVDRLLTGVSIGYKNDEYIAEQVFPSFSVKNQTDKHFIFDKGRFRTPANSAKRAAGASSNESTLTFTTGLPYFCEDHSLSQFVPDEDVDNAAPGMDPFTDAVENLTEQHFVSREVEIATALTDTGTMTQNTTLAGTSQWSDYSNSDPIKDIRTGAQTIHSSIFATPNTLILGKQVYDKLIDHPAIIERLKYSALGVATPEILARIVGVDRILIGASGKNTAKEGQTDSMSYIWGKNAVLAYINPRLGQKTITLGLTYQWKNRQVEKLRGSEEEDRKGTKVRVGNWYYDQNVVAATAGYLLKNAVA